MDNKELYKKIGIIRSILSQKEYLTDLDDMIDETLRECASQINKSISTDEIIKCSQCTHRGAERTDKNMIWCELHQFARPADHYCADGQKPRRNV